MNVPAVVRPKSQRSESANTPVVRVAYPFLHKRRAKNGKGTDLKNPRFDCSILVPKLNPDPAQCANYRWLWAHCVEAARKAWPGSVDGAGQWVWPVGGHISIQDGDKPITPKAPSPGQPVAPVDPNKYAWRRGSWIIEATHMLDPGPKIAVMANGVATEIPAQTVNGVQMYKSGDYAIVHLHAYTFENEKFGVNFGFEGVLFVGAGDAIGSSGGRSTEQMFGGVSAPNVPAAAPAALPTSPAASVAPVHSAPAYTTAPVAPVAPAPPPAAPSPAPIASTAPAYAPPPVAPAPPIAPNGSAPTAYPSSAPVLPAFPTR